MNKDVAEMDVAAAKQSVSISRRAKLPPKAQALYRTAVKFKKHTGKCKRKLSSFIERFNAAQRYSRSDAFEKISRRLTPASDPLRRFQFRKGARKTHRRKFTDSEKVFCLSILKRSSPVGYDLLHKIFTLPSRITLNRFITRVITPGIHKPLFYAVKMQMRRMGRLDKYCSLIFDETSLTPYLKYNRIVDVIEGFVETLTERQRNFADHALVFMAKGLCGEWQQAVAFSFSDGPTTAIELKKQLTMVITALQKIGLKVVNTVCDQAETNVDAVNLLINETKEKYVLEGKTFEGGFFKVQGRIIVPLYDTPHLLIGMRDIFMNKNLHYTLNGKRMVAKWEDVKAAYETDKKNESCRMFLKCTDAHVYPNSSQKKKLRFCVQIFSQRAASTIALFVRFPSESSRLNPEAIETAQLLVLMNNLFDSVNCRKRVIIDHKLLYSPLKKGSPHLKFWAETIPVLESMEFVDPIDGTVSKPPVIEHWISNLRGIQLIWKKLKKVGFGILLLRNLNQEPLEDLFGFIRKQGAQNTDPTCSAFITALKTITLDKFMSAKSLRKKYADPEDYFECDYDFDPDDEPYLLDLLFNKPGDKVRCNVM